MSSKAIGNFSAMSHRLCAENLGFSQGRKFQNQSPEIPYPQPLAHWLQEFLLSALELLPRPAWLRAHFTSFPGVSIPVAIDSSNSAGSTQLYLLSRSPGWHCPLRMGRHKPQPHFTVGSEPEHLRFSTLAGNRM
jgi:hypothetical protein